MLCTELTVIKLIKEYKWFTTVVSYSCSDCLQVVVVVVVVVAAAAAATTTTTIIIIIITAALAVVVLKLLSSFFDIGTRLSSLSAKISM